MEKCEFANDFSAQVVLDMGVALKLLVSPRIKNFLINNYHDILISTQAIQQLTIEVTENQKNSINSLEILRDNCQVEESLSSKGQALFEKLTIGPAIETLSDEEAFSMALASERNAILLTDEPKCYILNTQLKLGIDIRNIDKLIKLCPQY